MKPCEDYREQWVAYLDGELPSDELARMRDHLDGCDTCSDEVDGLQEALSLVDALAATAPSGSFAREFWQRLEGEDAASPGGWWRRLFQPRWVLIWGSGLAASLVAVLLWSNPKPAGRAGIDPAEAMIASHMDLFSDFEAIQHLDLLADLDVLEGMDAE